MSAHAFIKLERTVTHPDRASWLMAVWECIHAAEDAFADTDPDVWDDVKTAMAWIHEELEVDITEV